MSWGDGVPNPFEEEKRHLTLELRDRIRDLEAENAKLKEAIKVQARATEFLENSIRKNALTQAMQFLHEKLEQAKKDHDAVYATNAQLTEELELLMARLEDSGIW